MHRDQRFGEKLATPDTSIADLIGEVDPVKVAEGRYLSDELTIHYGLVPRTNRGIFAINELPDLAERIQVGLLNVLEERDVQIRGYKIRLPLDVLLVASANPEDYTDRGRIITPLKDRFGAQIRTHYPLDADTEIDVIVAGGRARSSSTGVKVAGARRTWPRSWPTISQLARQSPHVNQRSGVSVRLGVPTTRRWWPAPPGARCARARTEVVPRVSDLTALVSSTAGKVELDSLEDDAEDEVVARLTRQAVLTVFRDRVDPADLARAVAELDDGTAVEVGDDLPSSSYVASLDRLPGLRAPTVKLAGSESAAALAAAAELVLEGLHLSKRLNKHSTVHGARYQARRS